jgi:hypothetical protein
MNLSSTIAPKSDQTNADDLIAGPRTIKITAVEPGSSEQQPVNIRYDGDNGRPYKPSKGMRRALIAMWGEDGKRYVGRRLTLFNNPTITYGADATGGIQISHASDLREPLDMLLTIKRGKKKPFRVDPLVEAAAEFDIAAITTGGNEAAKLGTEAFRSWWSVLPAAAKAAIKPSLDAWKQTATAADENNKAK